MNIVFNITHSTKFGEEVSLNIPVADTDGVVRTATFKMNTNDGEHWSYRLDNLCKQDNPVIEFFFAVNNGTRELRREWLTVRHRLELATIATENATVKCRWMETPCDSYLYSSAFTDCINRRRPGKTQSRKLPRALRLVVRAPQLKSGAKLLLVGDDNCLGRWNPDKGIAMTEHNTNEWVADVDLTAFSGGSTEFKFVAKTDMDEIMWETGYNRHITLPDPHADGTHVIECDQAFFEICDMKLAGTLIPVFSLRTEGSFGVGDFGDLKRMVDWVAETGQRVLQILPINDTTTTHTWADCYPYSCISIFALHPQYADLRQLPPIDDEAERRRMEDLRKELNALPQIDYERVNRAKNEYLHTIFSQCADRTMKSAAFKHFFADNEHWLVPYAQYSYLRDAYGTADFEKWPSHREWCEAERGQLANPRTKAYKKLAYHYYIQFVLHQQMQAAHEYAKARGVILKGDIPIGVSRNGCDVWHEPAYFKMNAQAGAPPDAFAQNGQNWGFPTYNWDAMLADGGQWWIRRFQHMANYFDAYRIDHVLGFFRIWSIPGECVHALMGQFDPSIAMTRDEIESYGLTFDEERYTTPCINDWILERIFGTQADEVKQAFLETRPDGLYAMRPEYATERMIEAAFAHRRTKADTTLRDNLYKLTSNVLFVRDANDANKFHPRITAQLNFAFQTLSEKDRTRFNRLYDDYYYRRNNYFWYREAMKKLPMLAEATRMLVCAEDLGMVPECVAWVMEKLRILSLELQQMPKEYGMQFGNLAHNPYRSVCTISTHDMPTLRQWWDEDPARTQDYYSTVLYRHGDAPHPLPGWLAREIIERHLACPSMLCILALQDWLAIDERLRLPDANAERINIPADPNHYWRYRMHLNIDDLLADKGYNDTIKEMLASGGRRV